MRALLLLLPVLCLPAQADFETWLGANVNFKPHSRLIVNVEAQGRVQDMTTAKFLALRPSLGVRIGDSHSFWVGYGWTPLVEPVFRDEHRVFQQWLTQRRWTFWTLTARFRLEERFLPGASYAAFRWREMIRLTWHPNGILFSGVVLWDEFLSNINTNEVITAGFDQNRIFLGWRTNLNEMLALEAGYMNVQRKRPNGGFLIDHVLAAYFVWSLAPDVQPVESPLPAPPPG
jgi:hypothetical protein